MTDHYQPRKNGYKKDSYERPTLSKEEYKIKKEQERNELFEMLDDVTEEVMNRPESFENYLSTQARLDRYSASNALLIYRQMPSASRLKDFSGWGEDGVSIKKGEKHISILEPSEYTRTNGTKGVFYNPKSVFDISQTTAAKRPTAPSLNTNPSEILIAMLETAPVQVENVDSFGFSDTVAEYNNETGVLSVRRNVNDGVKLFQSVAVELAFAELSVNSEVYDRREMTFDAVCVANMLCKRFGVPSERFTIKELPDSWKNKDEKEVRAELSSIRFAASNINSRISNEIYRQRQEQNQDRSYRSRDDAR